MTATELDRLRELALALPEVSERVSHGAPCFFFRDRRPICYFHEHGSHGSGRPSIWCPAPKGVQEEMVASDPQRFFPPTPSASGIFADWLGVYLDTSTSTGDWDEIGSILREAFRMVAPKKLAAELDRAD